MAAFLKKTVGCSRWLRRSFSSTPPPPPMPDRCPKAAEGYTLNVKGSWMKAGEKVVWFGGALRDEDGMWLSGFAQRAKGRQIEEAELRACEKCMLKFLHFKQQSKITLFCDSWDVVNWLNGTMIPKQPHINKLLAIVLRVRQQCKDQGTDYTFAFAHSRWNRVAYSVVQYAGNKGEAGKTYECPPDHIVMEHLREDKESWDSLSIRVPFIETPPPSLLFPFVRSSIVLISRSATC